MSVTIDEKIKQTFPMNNTVFCDLPLLSSGPHNVRIDYDEDTSLSNFCKPSVVFGIGICEASQPGNCGNVSSSNPNGVSTQSSSTAAIPGASFPPPSPLGSAVSAATSEGNNLGNRVGAIVGGVIGGLVLVLLAAFAFLLLRRRRYLKKRAFIGGGDNIIRPLDDDATLPPPKYEDIGNQPRPLSSSMSTKSMIRPTLPQRSSMEKSIMSWNELRIDTGPQQTAQVGDDFGHSPLDSPRHEFRFSLSEVKRSGFFSDPLNAHTD
ncbi:hypothetical protein BDN70DRAFT_984298 [Pholiota conissans]|uniref:Uncharacterized protein n=1 Tax=Pholiota conissans TaxID=109636 RepID=A0A9P5Z4H1_9AGAR|nr:hypothetical protein BDN70DRAFT_984298 [Pholiota conissans]